MCLKMAEQRPDPIASVDDSIKYLDRFLFIQLIGLVQGEYLDMILEAPFGFEAWRKLCMEFEQLTAGRKLLAIEDLIHPDFGGDTVWRAQWLNWERLIEKRITHDPCRERKLFDPNSRHVFASFKL